MLQIVSRVHRHFSLAPFAQKLDFHLPPNTSKHSKNPFRPKFPILKNKFTFPTLEIPSQEILIFVKTNLPTPNNFKIPLKTKTQKIHGLEAKPSILKSY